MIIKCIVSLAAIVLACHSPAEVVRSMLGARGAIIGGRSGKELPYLRRVAYLESHGKEWIDTGIKRNRDDEFFVDFQFPNQTQSQQHSTVYGYENGNADRFMFRRFNTFGFYGYTAGGFLSIAPFDTGRHWCFAQCGVGFSFDGVFNIYTYQNNDASFNMFLFACAASHTSANAFGEVRIFSYYQKRNGDKIIDLIPVIDLSGRPAMYDEVSGNLFYNSGTGSFSYAEK